MEYTKLFSDRASAAQTSPLVGLFKLVQAQPDIVSFAVGAPDLNLLPIEMLPDLTSRAIKEFGRTMMQYGNTQGFPPLREAVQPLLKKRSVHADDSRIHISTGGSAALNNVCMALINKGDVILVEAPTYSPAVKAFLAYEAQVVEVASDDGGMLPEALEDQLKQHQVKFIYLLPTFQNPTGRTMPAERRKQIAELAQKYEVPMIEDDVYYDLRYHGEHIPAMYSFAPDNTIYLTSLSKIFAPAVRIGIAVMHPQLLEKVLILKEAIDMQTSSLTQAITYEFLRGDYEKHIAHINKAYGAKLELLLQTLERQMPKDWQWTKPDGGMFLWLTGPQTHNIDQQFLAKAVETGVVFVPGGPFYAGTGHGNNMIRLSFAPVPHDKIETGITRLAKTLGAR